MSEAYGIAILCKEIVIIAFFGVCIVAVIKTSLTDKQKSKQGEKTE